MEHPMTRIIIRTLLLLALVGCGGGEYPLANVSGVVTLDDNPLAGARVRFQPIHSGDSINAGPGSFGRTNEEGRFQLETIRGDNGAVVGDHKVAITTRQEEETANGGVRVVRKEEVPDIYNSNTTLTFTVPSGGTTDANFELTTAN